MVIMGGPLLGLAVNIQVLVAVVLERLVVLHQVLQQLLLVAPGGQERHLQLVDFLLHMRVAVVEMLKRVVIMVVLEVLVAGVPVPMVPPLLPVIMDMMALQIPVAEGAALTIMHRLHQLRV